VNRKSSGPKNCEGSMVPGHGQREGVIKVFAWRKNIIQRNSAGKIIKNQAAIPRNTFGTSEKVRLIPGGEGTFVSTQITILDFTGIHFCLKMKGGARGGKKGTAGVRGLNDVNNPSQKKHSIGWGGTQLSFRKDRLGGKGGVEVGGQIPPGTHNFTPSLFSAGWLVGKQIKEKANPINVRLKKNHVRVLKKGRETETSTS